MASPLFKVRVVSVEDQVLHLHVFIIHPDQFRIYASQSFALQVMWDPIHPVHGIDSALGREISMDQILDEGFVVAHQDRFVVDVEFVRIQNYPVTVPLDSLSHEEFEALLADESRLPQAVLEIVVTDPRWIAHLRPGMEWETCAYQMGG